MIVHYSDLQSHIASIVSADTFSWGIIKPALVEKYIGGFGDDRLLIGLRYTWVVKVVPVAVQLVLAIGRVWVERYVKLKASSFLGQW